jgi:hypothetical protein
MTRNLDAAARAAKGALIGGSIASLVSAVVLMRRGRAETGSRWAAINAPSHWFWGDRSLRRNGPSWRYTAVGALTHHGSSMFWALGYHWLQSRRVRPTPANAIADAAALTAVAAVVDLRLVPERLTPGFERRLSRRSLAWTYIGFGAGLALAGLWAQRARAAALSGAD